MRWKKGYPNGASRRSGVVLVVKANTLLSLKRRTRRRQQQYIMTEQDIVIVQTNQWFERLSPSVQLTVLSCGVFLFFGVHNYLQEAIMHIPGFHFGVMLGYLEVLGYVTYRKEEIEKGWGSWNHFFF